ncbi:hypothetical protein [Streptomyces spinosus]|uniref:hypothetical protein n=1 Tax=Streptomyces spinosus TaxID=2872623 RepID=UPI001CEDAAC7|nr:hypothetical protein [Streptomyces spinosus]
MATGPQKYPGASTSSWWQTKWGGDLMEVNVAVLHTTEGIGLPDYDGGSMAPNLTAVADMANKRLRWYQHFDIDRSSRALRNLAGGVQTNTLNVVQAEFDGTCDYSKRERWGSKIAGKDYIYWGNPPDWALRDMADYLRWLNANHGVPLVGPEMWLTYGPDSRRPGVTPASYGASPARMSFAAWESFKGVCGHQHVPENDHGDPGSLPFAKLIALAKGATQPSEEDPMPTPNEVAKAVLTLDGVIAVPGAPATNPTWTLSSSVTEILKRIDQVKATEAAQTAAITKLASLVGSGVDTATVVAAVQKAIADAVVKVSVNVTGADSKGV